MPHSPKPETSEVPTAEAVAPAAICSPLPDQRVVEVLDWLHTAMCELESAIRTLSPDPNSGELICARAAMRRAQSKIRELTDMSAACQANDHTQQPRTNA